MSIVSFADENGVVATADIFAFLNFWFADNTAFATGDEPRRARLGTGVNGVGSGDNPYGYCGYYFDAETAAAQILGPDTRPGGSAGGGGLYYVRHRIYDSYTGRWLTRDPAGFVDGMNLYEYCSGQSISCYDPLGLDDKVIHPGDPDDPNKKIPADYPTRDEREFLRERDKGFEWGRLVFADGWESLLDTALAAGGIFLEPWDWFTTAMEIVDDPGNGYSYVGLLPFVPSVAGKALKCGGKVIAPVADVVLKKLTKGNFRENLLRLTGKGIDKVDNLRAHHIVAHTDPRAAEARKILDKHGINVHDPRANGMWVPEEYHNAMHTDEYYKNIEKRLQDADKAGGKEKVLEELDKIKQEEAANIQKWQKEKEAAEKAAQDEKK